MSAPAERQERCARHGGGEAAAGGRRDRAIRRAMDHEQLGLQLAHRLGRIHRIGKCEELSGLLGGR